jgi:hypothetical protein
MRSSRCHSCSMTYSGNTCRYRSLRWTCARIASGGMWPQPTGKTALFRVQSGRTRGLLIRLWRGRTWRGCAGSRSPPWTLASIPRPFPAASITSRRKSGKSHRRKLGFMTFWKRNGWDGDSEVWRVEFRLTREFLHSVHIENVHDLPERLPSLSVGIPRIVPVVVLIQRLLKVYVSTASRGNFLDI